MSQIQNTFRSLFQIISCTYELNLRQLKMLAFLHEMGFVPRRIFPDGTLGETDPSSDDFVNLLCVRAE